METYTRYNSNPTNTTTSTPNPNETSQISKTNSSSVVGFSENNYIFLIFSIINETKIDFNNPIIDISTKNIYNYKQFNIGSIKENENSFNVYLFFFQNKVNEKFQIDLIIGNNKFPSNQNYIRNENESLFIYNIKFKPYDGWFSTTEPPKSTGLSYNYQMNKFLSQIRELKLGNNVRKSLITQSKKIFLQNPNKIEFFFLLSLFKELFMNEEVTEILEYLNLKKTIIINNIKNEDIELRNYDKIIDFLAKGRSNTKTKPNYNLIFNYFVKKNRNYKNYIEKLISLYYFNFHKEKFYNYILNEDIGIIFLMNLNKYKNYFGNINMTSNISISNFNNINDILN